MNVDKIYAIETHNETASSHGVEVEQISGDKFPYLYKQLLTLDDAIVDVGASNVEDFLDKMIKIEDSHVEFDYFVVPVTPDPSIQRECLKTIETLTNVGIPGNKIRLIFNRVAVDAEDEFSAIFAYAKKTKNCVANPECALFESEAYSKFAAKKVNVGAINADQTDYRQLIKSKSGTEKEQAHYADMHLLKGYSKGASRNLNAVFDELFK
jgi:hypothetical protein